MREWLVIEKSWKYSVFATDEDRKPIGYIPRDAAEALLGRALGRTVFFQRGESELMRKHPEWRDTEPPITTEVKMSDRVFKVDVGNGAAMTLPLRSWLWELRTQRSEPPRGTLADDRMLAAGVIESYLYLVNCSRDEAWRRIKLLRAAIKEAPGPDHVEETHAL